MKDLFEFESVIESSPIQKAAHRLSIKFSEDRNIPPQYRKGSDKQKRTNENSQIMTRFKSIVNILGNRSIILIWGKENPDF
jgi:hypothetical protein